MQQKGFVWIPAIAALVALAAACGSDSKPANPTTPSASVAADGTNAGADGTTLKVNAPALTSPIGGVRLETGEATLVFQAATGKFVQGQPYTYRVQLLSAASTLLEEKTGSALSYKMTTQFDTDTLYRWRVRAEREGMVGPWSVTETFKSMLKPSGYIKPDEIYDPLDNGKTVGTIHGDATFVPGGLKLNNVATFVEYLLTQTVTAGEFSMIVTNLDDMGASSAKTRIMSMRDGGGDIRDNRRRFTIEKRGDGTIAWRLISSSDQIETFGSANRLRLKFDEDVSFFFKATWGGAFNLQIFRGGIGGLKVYEMGEGYNGIYDPSPHYAFLGSPSPSLSGPLTVPGMIVRQVWLSSKPRPSWAQ